ncbi:MAG: hypothetical protein KF704_13850 [Crocinitomicaceae bacterium]|nr:hypothetical protein [Crocinitomicaceae bacterium]
MIQEILNFVAETKAKQNFYLIEDNLEEVSAFSDKAFNFIAQNTKNEFADLWGGAISDEDLQWERIGNFDFDWQLTLENTYLYGGFQTNGFYDALVSPAQPEYLSIECEHEFLSKEEERFLKEETNWFCKSAHGMGNGTNAIFHRAKDKYPFDILFLDRGILFKTDFTLESYYQSMIDSAAVCGWQYFYLDFEEIKKKCADFKVGQRWLTLYPYNEGMAASPFGSDVTKETSRLDALLHHMEVCVYFLPKIFPEKEFTYHANRLNEFKEFLNK